jgi:hypothetical protein
LLAASHAEGAVTFPSTSRAEGAATSLLLEQIKQMPHVKTVRKQICGGTEVITLGEVSERRKETVSKSVKDGNRQEKKKTTKKKEESSDSEQLKPQAVI